MALSDYDIDKDKNKGQGPVANNKKNESDPSKYDQNNQSASGQGVKAAQKGPMQLAGTRYGDMTADYQSNVSKQEYKERRQAQRMAGDALQDGNLKKQINQNYKVDNLEDFDLRATGTGGTLGNKYREGEEGEDARYGRGRARFSKSDAIGLMEKGDYNAKELMKYGKGLDGESGEVFGSAAQKFLKRQIKQQKTDNSQESTNVETDGGGNTGGQTNAGNNANTPNPQAGATAPQNSQASAPQPGTVAALDTPVSDMTVAMGPTFQPAESSSDFVSRFVNMNKKAQKDKGNSPYKKYLEDEVDVTKLDQRIGQRALYHQAQSKLAGLNVYGDHDAYKSSNWTSPLGEDPIESPDLKGDTEDIYGRIEKAAG